MNKIKKIKTAVHDHLNQHAIAYAVGAVTTMSVITLAQSARADVWKARFQLTCMALHEMELADKVADHLEDKYI